MKDINWKELEEKYSWYFIRVNNKQIEEKKTNE